MEEREVLTLNAHFKNPVNAQTVDLEPPSVSNKRRAELKHNIRL